MGSPLGLVYLVCNCFDCMHRERVDAGRSSRGGDVGAAANGQRHEPQRRLLPQTANDTNHNAAPFLNLSPTPGSRVGIGFGIAMVGGVAAQAARASRPLGRPFVSPVRETPQAAVTALPTEDDAILARFANVSSSQSSHSRRTHAAFTSH